MQKAWIIALRELKHYMISPISYAVAFLLFSILGVVFYTNLITAPYQQYAPSIEIIIVPFITLLFLVIPALTMRVFAEENRDGTLELILTTPIHDFELVIGKWLGVFLLFSMLTLLTLIYPFILNLVITPGIDAGLVAANYIGLLLLIAAMTAIGTAISSFISSQSAAFVVTLGVLLFMWMLSYPAQSLGTYADALRFFDLSGNFYSTFFNGVIALKSVIYYLSLTTLGLFFSSMAIQARRWK